MDDTPLGKYSHDYSVIYGEEIARFYDVTDYIVFTGASKKISELVACMLKARNTQMPAYSWQYSIAATLSDQPQVNEYSHPPWFI